REDRDRPRARRRRGGFRPEADGGRRPPRGRGRRPPRRDLRFSRVGLAARGRRPGAGGRLRGKTLMRARRCGQGWLGGGVWIAVSIIHLAAGCAPKASTRSDVVRPVKTAVVTAGEEAHVRSFPGKAEASKKVELAFQVSGLLVKFPVKEGQKVAK